MQEINKKIGEGNLLVKSKLHKIDLFKYLLCLKIRDNLPRYKCFHKNYNLSIISKHNLFQGNDLLYQNLRIIIQLFNNHQQKKPVMIFWM